MIKIILWGFLITNLFSSTYLSNELKNILDLEEKDDNLSQYQVLDKMSYKEFIQFRSDNDIERTESWGTEVMYELYLYDKYEDINRILTSIDKNYNHFSMYNIYEIRIEIESKFNQNILPKEYKDILSTKIAQVEYEIKNQNAFSGGGESSSSSSSSSDSGGHGDDGGDDDDGDDDD